jgi:hypothetical protein
MPNPTTRTLPTAYRAVALVALLIAGTFITLAAPPPPPPPPKSGGGQQQSPQSPQTPQTPAGAKVWSGTWSNKKFNTTGPLTCTVIGEQNGQWIARFTGTGVGKPFTQVAYITPKGTAGNTNLSGTAKVEGDSYQWTGTANAQSMTGSFRSGSGNNGDFRLASKK